MKILFLGANARNTTRLRLDAEVRDVRDEIARAEAGDAVQLEAALAVRPEDFSRHLLDHEPHVLHFSGHGSGTSGGDGTRSLVPDEDGAAGEGSGGDILVENEHGVAVAIRPEALAGLLELVRRDSALCCVVLNACSSAALARQIAEHVDCVIGMKRAIDDRSAIAFAVGFYRAIARGKSIGAAFDFGCSEIAVRNLPDQDAPEIFHRPNVDPHKLFVHEPEKPAQGPSQPPRPTPNRPHRGVAYAVVFALGLGAVLALHRIHPGKWNQVQTASTGLTTWLRQEEWKLDVLLQSGTIVIAEPSIAGAADRKTRPALCDALDHEQREKEPPVACIRTALTNEVVRAKAHASGASLLVLVNANGIASLVPLGRLANHEILGRGLPRVDVSGPDSAARLAPLLRSLAHIVQTVQGERFQPTRLRCAPETAGMPHSITLLSLFVAMYAPGCRVAGVDWQQLLEPCQPEFGSEECKLAGILCAHSSQSCPAPPKLQQLLQESGVQAAATLQGARDACKAGKLDEAEKAALWLWSYPDVCVQLTASQVAACILSRRKQQQPWGSVSRGLQGPDTELDLDAVEKFPDVCMQKREASACLCPELYPGLHAGVLSERAWWRARGYRWLEAEADYRSALELVDVPSDRLDLVEVLLHQGPERTAEAIQFLDRLPVPSLKPHERVHKALLAWIAARHEGNALRIEHTAQSLLDAYEKFPPGQRPFEDRSNHVLRSLVCPDNTVECIYDVLTETKSPSSAGIFEKALHAAAPTRGLKPR